VELGEAGWTLAARLPTAPLDARRHGFRGEIKAATYHRLEVDASPGSCRARVILDV
jgi:SHS2 domain-containing protein